MKQTKSRFNNGIRDEDLLMEGKYGEWFWKGMSENAVAYLRAAENPTYSLYRLCNYCKVRKPVGSFNIGTLRASWNRCNKCALADTAHSKSGRWEGTSPVGWQEQASCDGVDPEVFFPEKRNDYLDPDAEWRQYCPDCPVKQLCEDYAYQSKSAGIFGGKFFTWKSTTRTVLDENSKKKGRPKKAV